jgi:hypothetical protein
MGKSFKRAIRMVLHGTSFALIFESMVQGFFITGLLVALKTICLGFGFCDKIVKI